jgi:hypothetical protein
VHTYAVFSEHKCIHTQGSVVTGTYKFTGQYRGNFPTTGYFQGSLSGLRDGNNTIES